MQREFQQQGDRIGELEEQLSAEQQQLENLESAAKVSSEQYEALERESQQQGDRISELQQQLATKIGQLEQQMSGELQPVPSARDEALALGSPEQTRRIAELEREIAGLRSLAMIGETTLNKWRKRSFS